MSTILEMIYYQIWNEISQLTDDSPKKILVKMGMSAVVQNESNRV